ncbi:hypothetical protein GCM10010350_71820 [Streptomyces galilaeus]|nr:hypothetical protein GCM10010350_71820 [Streptomyces galilaeus]
MSFERQKVGTVRPGLDHMAHRDFSKPRPPTADGNSQGVLQPFTGPEEGLLQAVQAGMDVSPCRKCGRR